MRSGLEFWHDAYAGKPMRVFWVLNSPEAIDFVPASSRQWISYDPFERTTIAMSDFPAGKLTQAAATSPPLAVRSSAH